MVIFQYTINTAAVIFHRIAFAGASENQDRFCRFIVVSRLRDLFRDRTSEQGRGGNFIDAKDARINRFLANRTICDRIIETTVGASGLAFMGFYAIARRRLAAILRARRHRHSHFALAIESRCAILALARFTQACIIMITRNKMRRADAKDRNRRLEARTGRAAT